MNQRNVFNVKKIFLLVIFGCAISLCCVVFGTNQTASAQDTGEQNWNPFSYHVNKYAYDPLSSWGSPDVEVGDTFSLQYTFGCACLSLYYKNEEKSQIGSADINNHSGIKKDPSYVSLVYNNNDFKCLEGSPEKLFYALPSSPSSFKVLGGNDVNSQMKCYFEYAGPFVVKENSEQGSMGSIDFGSGPWSDYKGDKCAYITPHDDDATDVGSSISVDENGNLTICGVDKNSDNIPDATYSVNVIPNDDYVFDCWEIDYYFDDVDPIVDPSIENVIVNPGIEQGLLFYGSITPHFKEAASPEPEPTPDPTPVNADVQEVSTAQTADNIPMGLISFIILLIVASSCYVITRRAYGRK